MQRLLVGLVCGLVAIVSWAGEAEVRAGLAKIISGVQVDQLRASPVPGIYEVVVGGQVFYMSADGEHLFTGDLFQTSSQENVTERTRAAARLSLLGTVEEKTMIVFAPEKATHVVTVFTDVDCPYCAKFHRDVPKLVEGGVKVRYLAFPRTGLDTPSYRRSVAVWCAEDPQRAMGTAKSGGELEMKDCANPVTDHVALGTQIGIQGTPTIILGDGRALPGYVPADRLLALLSSDRQHADKVANSQQHSRAK